MKLWNRHNMGICLVVGGKNSYHLFSNFFHIPHHVSKWWASTIPLLSKTMNYVSQNLLPWMILAYFTGEWNSRGLWSEHEEAINLGRLVQPDAWADKRTITASHPLGPSRLRQLVTSQSFKIAAASWWDGVNHLIWCLQLRSLVSTLQISEATFWPLFPQHFHKSLNLNYVN